MSFTLSMSVQPLVATAKLKKSEFSGQLSEPNKVVFHAGLVRFIDDREDYNW